MDDSVVTSFKLHIYYSPDIGRPAVNRWSKSPIIRNNVKELDICGRQEHIGGIGDFMPSVALNGRSSSIIKLKSVKLDGTCSMNLPSLRSLCLEFVGFRNNISNTIRKLMIGSPSLEKLVLDYCDTSGDIQISSPSLKNLEFKTECDSVDIYALNLQSLAVYSIRSSRIGFSSCTAIRDLSLSDFCNGKYQNFDYQISKLTCLENLTLTICEDYETMNIVSPTLKYFSLTTLYKQELEVVTETPNLVSFEYDGTTEFSITMKTPNPQLSGSLSIWPQGNCDTDCYTELITFLSNINCSWNSLSLCSYENKAFIIPKKMRKTCRLPYWPNLKHLKVTTFQNLTRKSELRKALEWLSPSLETLSIEKASRFR